MGKAGQLVVFSLDQFRFALPLTSVERVVRATEVTPIPQAPHAVSGVVDMQGEVVPVLDVRQRMGLRSRPIGLADEFLVARMRGGTVALVVDRTEGLADPDELVAVGGGPDAAWLDQFQGIAQLGDGLVLIQDLEKFLSSAEAAALAQALERAH
jgi:purine-binding chemotaxis protein CheW